VNDSWRPPQLGARGPVSRLRRLAAWLLAPQLDAQARFNADQVRLDNELLAYVAAHLRATHAHYDTLNGLATKRMNEIDTRHLELQERLLLHVRELLKRIDFVLETAERSRLSGETELRRLGPTLEALARRLEQLEERLGRQ
jgi:hypothetical protein